MSLDLREISIREFAERDTDEIISLWEMCGLTRPWNDPRADISRKLTTQPELFLVAQAPEPRSRIIGSVMAGYDGHRGWMYYLATAPSHRGIGLGTVLVAEVESRLAALGCPKVQLMVRSENRGVTDFYGALGYESSDVLVLGKRLADDR